MPDKTLAQLWADLEHADERLRAAYRAYTDACWEKQEAWAAFEAARVKEKA